MEKVFININGSIFPVSEPIERKGFGLFETMRFINGRINPEGLHFERLFDGMDKLEFKKPESFTIEKIREEIKDLCKKNSCFQKARVRLSVIQNNDDEIKFSDYFIEAIQLNKGEELNEGGMVIDIFPGEKKNCDIFLNLKTTNRQLYENAEKFAKENKLDDCLILNEYDRICESTISNIFWIKQEMIYTPPLTEGCVAGIMRRYLIERMKDAGYKIFEAALMIEELIGADEVFLTNALRGIRTIKQFRNKIFSVQETLQIKNKILKDFF